MPNLFRFDSLLKNTSFAPKVFTEEGEAYNRLKSALLFILSDSVRLLFIGNRQFLSAFLPPAGQNISSPPGLHPGPETEFPGPFGAARLVGTFHVPASLSAIGPISTIADTIEGLAQYVNQDSGLWVKREIFLHRDRCSPAGESAPPPCSPPSASPGL